MTRSSGRTQKPGTLPELQRRSYFESKFAAVLVLGVIALLPYLNSFRGELIFDSRLVILNDTRVHALTAENLGRIFTENYWGSYVATNLYRPVTTLSYLVNWSVFGNGERPLGYHVVNFGLHWINVVLVWAVVRRLSGKTFVAVAAAWLFAVHPIATEAVTNVVGRADEFAATGVLGALWCRLRVKETEASQRRKWIAGVGAFSFLAVFSKESGVAVVPAILLYDLVFDGLANKSGLGAWFKAWWMGSWRIYGALAVPVAALLAARVWVLGAQVVAPTPFVDNPIGYAEFFPGAMTAFKVLGRYVGLLVWPAHLSSDYSYNQIPLYGVGSSTGENIESWVALLVTMAVAVWAILMRVRYPLVSWGVLFFFAALLPVSNLLFPIGTIMGERLLYLPSVGFYLVAASGIAALGNWVEARSGGEKFSRVSIAVLAGLSVALGIRTAARNSDWRDILALSTNAVATAPNSSKNHTGLAKAIWQEEKSEAGVDRAIAEAEISVAILEKRVLSAERRTYVPYQNLADYYLQKATFLKKRGELARGKEYTQKAVAMLLKAAAIDQSSAALAKESRGKNGKSLEGLAELENEKIYESLAHTYLVLQLPDEALKAALYARQLDPRLPQPHFYLGVSLMGLRRYEDAAIVLSQALISGEESRELWENLQACYDKLGLKTEVILSVSGRRMLNHENPVVRDHATKACVDLYFQFLEANLPKSAEEIRQRAMRELGCAPEAFRK